MFLSRGLTGRPCLRTTERDNQRQREIDRCERELAEAERLLREGHPDIAGLCLALHDWAQELRILHQEREQWMSES